MEPHDEFISRSEVQEMIDIAIDKCNKTTILIAAISLVLLLFFTYGTIFIIDKVI